MISSNVAFIAVSILHCRTDTGWAGRADEADMMGVEIKPFQDSASSYPASTTKNIFGDIFFIFDMIIDDQADAADTGLGVGLQLGMGAVSMGLCMGGRAWV